MKYLMLPFFSLFVLGTSQAQTPCSLLQGKSSDTKEETMLFITTEVMPRLLVRGAGSNESPERNSDQYLLQFIQKNLRYPLLARDCSIRGTVVISFVIGTDGLIDTSTVKCRRDIGAGFGEEGIRIVQLMATLGWRWTPGTVLGKAVPVQFNLPIKIRLE